MKRTILTAGLSPGAVSGLAVSVAIGGVAWRALAQTPCPPPPPPPFEGSCLTNASFEDTDPFNPSSPQGWHNLSNPGDAQWREVGDAGSPAAVARTGTHSVMLRTPGHSEFRGWTTDTLNFFDPSFPFYDPVFDWNGGDVVVSGWYYIPTTDPIVGDTSFLKLNIKRGNQDYATYDAIAEGTPEQRIQGDTNNEWRRYEIRWTIADIHAEVEFNRDQGYFVLPPYPDHLKITISRFGYDNAESGGVIFWDDMSFVQEPGAPACSPCVADFNNSGGTPDDADAAAFFAAWNNGDGCADANGSGGTPDDADISTFFTLWNNGGC